MVQVLIRALFSSIGTEGPPPLSGLRIKENKEVYEGEVTELTPEYTEAAAAGQGAGAGYGKVRAGGV